MDKEQIKSLVKKLEPHFLGYQAHDNRLKNDIDMEIIFQENWRGQTKVSIAGTFLSCYQEIGCSFEKPISKIVADIKRRLLPKYYENFLSYQKEERELEQREKEKKQRLEALAQISGGKVSDIYDNGSKKGVFLKNFEISPSYGDSYKISIRASFGEALKIAEYLKEFYKTEKPDSL